MDLSTFSTGFSTAFVKKKGSFPRCFPLFPLSFQPFQGKLFIHEVFSRNILCGFWEILKGLFLFSKRKPNRFLFFFHQSPEAVKCFPHSMHGKSSVLKTVGKLCFSTKKHLRCPRSVFDSERGFKRRCSVLFGVQECVTSCSGTRAGRSGSTGSNCMRPRWS